MAEKSLQAEKGLQKVELLKPKNDIVFQSLFNQNNERITKAFVEALLEEKIEKIVINNDKELMRENPEDKLGILDLQLDVNNNEKVDVEIQLLKKNNFSERLLYYFSRLYSNQIKKGGSYREAKRVVIIAIVDFPLNLTKGIKKIETEWNLREKNCPNLVLTNHIEFRIIEIEKVKKYYRENENSQKAQWMLFLDDPNSREACEIMEKNEEIKEATVVVKKMSKDEKLSRLAFLREKAILDEKAMYDDGLEEGMERGEKVGLEKGKVEGEKVGLEKGRVEGEKVGLEKGEKVGLEKGRTEERRTMVKNMLKKGIEDEIIKQIAEISDAELEEIKQLKME